MIAESLVKVMVRGSFILVPMQEAAANHGSTGGSSSVRGWSSSLPSSSSFAGLLASLTSPDPSPAAGWNADDLADDVATLSYESALRTHGRYKPVTPGAWGPAQSTESQVCRACGASPSDAAASAQKEAQSVDSISRNDSALNSSHAHFTMKSSKKKCASVTIRMSERECEQLKKRAAEAGLTISAYLRSCTFEAETLRAEVKKTLEELRKPASPERIIVHAKARSGWFEWLSRLIPLWHLGPRVARV